MATVYTLTEPKEAWALVSHLLGNYLLVIDMYSSSDYGNLERLGEERCERIVSDSRAQLIGSMYMIVRNLNKHGHADNAAKIQQILDMITDQNVTDPEIRKAIHAKHEEFDAGMREFKAALEQMRGERAASGQ